MPYVISYATLALILVGGARPGGFVDHASVLPSRTRIALAVIAGVAAMLIYAGQFVLSRWSFQRTLSLWDLATLRFAVAGLLALPIVLRHGLAGAAGVGWRRAAVLAVSAGGPYTLILYAGLTLSPAAHGAVIIPGATPVVSTMLVWLWLREWPRPGNLAGLALIVAGLVLVGWPGLGDAGDRTWAGDLLFVAAGILWALFTVLTRRWQIDPVRGTAMVWLLALAYVPIYALAVGTRPLLDAPRAEVVGQALYQGVGVAIVALVLYAWAIRVLGSSFASLFMPLIPLFGVLLGIPVLGEIPTPLQLLGMLAVSVGMGIASILARPRALVYVGPAREP
jgi:drug/metabolite transporter (DMT)-like permease